MVIKLFIHIGFVLLLLDGDVVLGRCRPERRLVVIGDVVLEVLLDYILSVLPVLAVLLYIGLELLRANVVAFAAGVLGVVDFRFE